MASGGEESPQKRSWKKPPPIRNPSEFTLKVTEANRRGRLLPARDMVSTLGMDISVNTAQLKELILGQYKIAAMNHNWNWVSTMHKEALLFLNRDWIVQNIPHRDAQRNRVEKRRQESTESRIPGEMVRDRRLKECPDLPTIKANAGELKVNAVEHDVVIPVHPMMEETAPVKNRDKAATPATQMERPDETTPLKNRDATHEPIASRRSPLKNRDRSSSKKSAGRSPLKKKDTLQQKPRNRSASKSTRRSPLKNRDTLQPKRSPLEHRDSYTSKSVGRTPLKERDISQKKRSPLENRDRSASKSTIHSPLKERDTLQPKRSPLENRDSQPIPMEKRARHESPTPCLEEGSMKTSTKPDRSSLCHVPECGLRTRKLKKHYFIHHLPMVLGECISTPNASRHRLDILAHLARWIVGPQGDPGQLMRYINTRRLPYFSQTISEELQVNMDALCRLEGWRRPKQFSLVPLNSPACLLHWRILAELLKLLPGRRREELTKMHGGLPPDARCQPDSTEPVTASELLITVSLDGTSREVSESSASMSVTVHTGQSHEGLEEHPDAVPVPVYTSQTQEVLQEHQAVVPVPVPTGQSQEVFETHQDVVTLTGHSSELNLLPVHTGQYQEEVATHQDVVPIQVQSLGLNVLPVHTGAAADEGFMLSHSEEASPKFVVPKMSASVPQQPTFPAAIDSHYHLDRTRLRLWGPHSRASSEQLIQYSCVPAPNPRVFIYGGVEVYCDPEDFPIQLHNHPSFKIALGVHPKLIHQLTPERMEYFRNTVTSPYVTAIGEIGIDRTVDCELWARQVEVLEDLTRVCDGQKPLVLHIRGSRQDTYGSDAHACVREIVRENCHQLQPIHLHCFTSESSQVRRWLRIFPNCFFSFSGQVLRFTPGQEEAVRNVPSDRLLVETDSPYLHPRGHSLNMPSYIGEVAAVVARIRGEDFNTLLNTTVANARLLYSIQ